MTPSETPREPAPADAARRQFIEKYGPLALATPAAVYALMSPGRAQAQIGSGPLISQGACQLGVLYVPGQYCDIQGTTTSIAGVPFRFSVLWNGEASWENLDSGETYTSSSEDTEVLWHPYFKAQRIPGSGWNIIQAS